MAKESKIGIEVEEETKNLAKIAEKLEDTIKYEFDKGIEQIDVEEMGKAIDMLKDVYEAKEKCVKACFYAYTLEEMEKQSEEGGEEEMMDDERRGYRGQPRSQSGRFMSRGDGRRSNGGGRGRGRGRRGYEDMMMYDDDEDWEEMERMRDFDRLSGKMYYSGSGSSGGSSGGSQGGGQSSGGMSGGSSSGGSSGGSSSGGSMGYSESGRGSQGGRGQSSRSENARRGYEESKMMQDGSPESKKKAMESLESYLKELSEDMTDLVSKMDANEKSMVKNKLQVLAQKVS